MRNFFTFLFFLLPMTVLACPNCHTSVSDESKPPYTLIILGLFIVVTYIPFYVLFSAAKKYDPKNSDGNQ
jgi:hypothetical protein